MTFDTKSTFIKIGHRGACGYKSENTLSSFKKALQLKVDMIELDVHVCASGEIVVIHDSTLKRTTNGMGNVVDQSLDELKKLTINTKHKIPTLIEALNFIDKQIPINIELKGIGTALGVTTLIKHFIKNNKWENKHFLVSSFNYEELESVKFTCSEIRLGLLCKKLPNNFEELIQKFNPYALCIYHKTVTQEIIERAHAYDLKVLVYTVNNKQEIKCLKNKGVDGIFSDYPDRL